MAIVYKYLSPDLTECYVGSTVDEVNRKSSHKCGSRTTSKLLFEKYGYDNCSYVILEVCPLEERRTKEQWWLDHSVGAVNERKAFRTEEERREQEKAIKKAHYESNKEKILAREKARYKENREQKKEYAKAYREAHREQINSRRRVNPNVFSKSMM